MRSNLASFFIIESVCLSCFFKLLLNAATINEQTQNVRLTFKAL